MYLATSYLLYVGAMVAIKRPLRSAGIGRPRILGLETIIS